MEGNISHLHFILKSFFQLNEMVADWTKIQFCEYTQSKSAWEN